MAAKIDVNILKHLLNKRLLNIYFDVINSDDKKDLSSRVVFVERNKPRSNHTHDPSGT